jgi:catalase
VLEAYKHCKPICVIGEGVELLRSLGITGPDAVPQDAGVVVGTNEPTGRIPMAQAFIAAMARHRHWARPGVEAVPA